MSEVQCVCSYLPWVRCWAGREGVTAWCPLEQPGCPASSGQQWESGRCQAVLAAGRWCGVLPGLLSSLLRCGLSSGQKAFRNVAVLSDTLTPCWTCCGQVPQQ